MLLNAAKDWHINLDRSFLVGDKPRDCAAALAAGVSPILVGDYFKESSEHIAHVQDLIKASSFILGADISLT